MNSWKNSVQRSQTNISPPRTGQSTGSRGWIFAGVGEAITIVDNLKENFRTSFAKKSDVEEIEKTVDIISKFTIQDEHKKKKEQDKWHQSLEDRMNHLNHSLIKIEREFNDLTTNKIKMIEQRLLEKLDFEDF